MPLYIRNEDVNGLAVRLAARKGLNKTDAVKLALENEFCRLEEACATDGSAPAHPGPDTKASPHWIGRGQGVL